MSREILSSIHDLNCYKVNSKIYNVLENKYNNFHPMNGAHSQNRLSRLVALINEIDLFYKNKAMACGCLKGSNSTRDEIVESQQIYIKSKWDSRIHLGATISDLASNSEIHPKLFTLLKYLIQGNLPMEDATCLTKQQQKETRILVKRIMSSDLLNIIYGVSHKSVLSAIHYIIKNMKTPPLHKKSVGMLCHSWWEDLICIVRKLEIPQHTSKDLFDFAIAWTKMKLAVILSDQQLTLIKYLLLVLQHVTNSDEIMGYYVNDVATLFGPVLICTPSNPVTYQRNAMSLARFLIANASQLFDSNVYDLFNLCLSSSQPITVHVSSPNPTDNLNTDDDHP